MRLDDYNEKDGKRVWLSASEITQMLDQCDRPRERIALSLAGRSGLRRAEVVNVRYKDVQQAASGFLRIFEGKGGKYREAPITDELQAIVASRAYDADPDDRICEVSTGSRVYAWVKKIRERCHDETGDPGWDHVGPHDLRRSWGGHMLWNKGVMPVVVMEWGGWTDWATFRDHYLGQMTPEAMDRERHKAYSGDGQALEDWSIPEVRA